MSRKHSLPNVDEDALAALARQFPSMSAPPESRDERPREPPPNGMPPAGAALPADPDRGAAADRAREAAPPIDASATPPEPRVRRRGGGRVIASLAMLVALVALAVALGPAAPPRLRAWLTTTIGDPAAVDLLTGNRAVLDARLAVVADDLAALKDQQAQIATRLEAIEAVGGSSDVAARRVAAVESGIKAAEARIDATEGADKTAGAAIATLRERADAADTALKATADRLPAVEDGIKKAESAIAALAKSGSAEKLFLTALQLRSAVRLSGPFAPELAAVRAAAAGGNAETLAAVKALAAYAPTGVPTMPELHDSFSLYVAPRVIALSPAAQKGLTDRTKDWVQSMFVSRSADDVVGGDRNATIIALAERNLAKGQLAAAVDQLALLEDQAALVASEWLKSASARLTTDKATASLMAQAFTRLAATN
jgi:hypothetical protein